MAAPSIKGKTTGKKALSENPCAFKKFSGRDLMIYSDDEKVKKGARKSEGVDGWRIARKPPLAIRKSVPANMFSKQDLKINVENEKGVTEKGTFSVKIKSGRKALADVSNIKKCSLRNRPSDASRLKISVKVNNTDANFSSRKLKIGEIKSRNSQSSEDLHSFNDGSNETDFAESLKLCTDGMSHQSLVVTDSESKTIMAKGYKQKSKSSMANFKFSQKTKGESNISVERTRRKPLVEISNTRTHQLERSKDGLKLSNTQSGKSISKPAEAKLSFTSQMVNTTSSSSRGAVWKLRKVTGTSSKVRLASRTKRPSYSKMKRLSSTGNSYMEKEAKLATGCTHKKTEVFVSYGRNLDNNSFDDNVCSSKTVTAVISKARNGRRKSYTSLLMERSKVLGECDDCVKELPNIDDPGNHMEVVEYVDDIYQYYWFMEQARNPSLENYMAMQRDITPRMRGILVNWLIEVHLKFELMQETLFLMVELLDRFLSTVPISKAEMQLVGLTSLLLASKYEDFWHPKIKDLISLSDNIYTRDQMLAMEKLILKNLMFRLNAPTPYVFMLRFLKAAQSDPKLENLAFYLIELSLVEYETLKFKSSLLCASAIFVARCTLQLTPTWTELLKKHTHYDESQLRPCAEMILRLQRAAGQGQLKVTYEKYISADRGGVAGLKAINRLPV